MRDYKRIIIKHYDRIIQDMTLRDLTGKPIRLEGPSKGWAHGRGRYCKRHMKYFRKDSSRKYCPKPRRDSEDFLSSPCVSDCRSGYQWSLLLRFLNQSGKCPWLEEVLNPKVFALNYYSMLFYCGLYHLI